MRKSAKICLTILTAVILAFTIVAICFFSSTLSAAGCIDYCRKNTKSGANEFFAIGDDMDGKKYVYYIASDVEPGKSQELFVFERTYLDRYKFLLSSSQGGATDGGEKVGSLKFFPGSGDKDGSTGAALLFFGSIADAKIAGCEYSLILTDGEETFMRKKPLTNNNNKVWLIGFYGLSDYDNRTVKDVTSASFFDEDGKLVATYSK